jgi:hypothetical protein
MLTMLITSRGIKYTPSSDKDLVVLTHEHDNPATLDPCHRVIAETHGVEHHCVELCERRLTVRHVVGRPDV